MLINLKKKVGQQCRETCDNKFAMSWTILQIKYFQSIYLTNFLPPLLLSSKITLNGRLEYEPTIMYFLNAPCNNIL